MENTVSKKKGKALPIVIVIVAVLAVAAVLVGVFFGQLKGLCIKTFGSDEAYFQYVAGKALSSGIGDALTVYGGSSAAMKQEKGQAAELKVNVSDKAHNVIKTYVGADMSWLSELAVTMQSVKDGDVTKTDAQLQLSGTEIVTVSALLNMKSDIGYLTANGLTNKYLALDLTDANVDDGIADVLPTAEELKPLLKKYLGIVMNNLNDVSRVDKSVTLEDVEQALTELTITIDSATLKAVATDVLTAIKQDEEIKRIVGDVVAYLKEQGELDNDEDPYAAFIKSVDEALANVKNEELDEDALLVMLYVDNTHNVVGSDVRTKDDAILLSHMTVTDGEKFVSQLAVGDSEMGYNGSGTVVDGKRNGKFTVFYGGYDMVDIVLEEVDAKSGKITVAPTNDVLTKLIPAQAGSILALLEPTVAVEYDYSDVARAAISLNSKDEALIRVEMTAKDIDNETVELPAETDVMPAEDAEEWMQTLDLNKVIAALKEAGVPEGITQSLAYVAQANQAA